MNWKNFKLSTKFVISFGLIIGILIVFSFWVVSGINGIIGNAGNVIDGNKLRTEINQRYVDHLKWSVKLGEYILDPLKDELNIEKNFHNCAFGKWYYGEDRANAEKLVPQLKEIFAQIEKPHQLLHETAEKITVITKDNSLDSAQKVIAIQKIYKTETIEQLDEVGKLLMEVVTVSKENIMTDEVMIAQAENTNFLVILVSLFVAVIAIIFATIIARGIILPINKGVDFATQISKGDLTATIDIYQEDEIGKLSDALRNMVEKLREIVSSFLDGATNIASASNQMSANSQQVSQGASEQASSAEEISSSMEEMVSNIQQNTDNAQQTEKISAKAALDIIEGSNNVNQTVEAMKKIADKVAIISDIAFQTNILALNAAVEAARAGEHGKGFAVVAAEVRKLAERSQIAANEINGLSKSSVEIAVKSGNLLNAIVPDIQKTSKLVQEITAASIEQNSGADQINNAINQLNQVTQQNAAASEEMATSSEELSSQAEQLQDIISFFKIDNNASKSRKTVTVKKSTSNKFVHLENKNVSQNHNKNKGAELQMFDNKHDVDFEKF